MSSLHLPEYCGVMLLPDATLFPHGGLPLHIFEPRYLTMLEDALQGSCFFAIARRIGEESLPLEQQSSPIGTIGLIRASRELDNGTSNLLLHGVIRVRFSEWVEESSYPRARIEPIPSVFEPSTQSEAALESLREAAENVTRELPDEVKVPLMTMAEQIDDPAVLADVMAQQFVHHPDERQFLLELDSVPARIAWLCRKFASP